MRLVREIIVDGDVALIPLTRGLEAIIDVEDHPLVDGFNWFAKPDKSNFYAARTDRSYGQQRTIRLHRWIMDAPPDMQVDHKDGNGLNNRRSNLRLATNEQNQFNQRLRKDNTSGVKGVVWDAYHEKWHARIAVHSRLRHLGRYSSIEDAREAYARASAVFHGEFGRTE
jgi:hypothetical protein